MDAIIDLVAEAVPPDLKRSAPKLVVAA